MRDTVELRVVGEELPGHHTYPVMLLTPVGGIPLTAEELLRLKYAVAAAINIVGERMRRAA